MSQTRIGHAHLKVRDLDSARDFYTRFLGLREVERIGNHYLFLSAGDMHHEVALQNVGPHAPAPSPLATGLYHVAFELPGRAALAQTFFALREAGVEVAPVDHLISWALYFSDPDGNGLEVYCDTRGEPGGARLWRGQNRPLTEPQLRAALDRPDPAAAAR